MICAPKNRVPAIVNAHLTLASPLLIETLTVCYFPDTIQLLHLKGDPYLSVGNRSQTRRNSGDRVHYVASALVLVKNHSSALIYKDRLKAVIYQRHSRLSFRAKPLYLLSLANK